MVSTEIVPACPGVATNFMGSIANIKVPLGGDAKLLGERPSRICIFPVLFAVAIGVAELIYVRTLLIVISFAS